MVKKFNWGIQYHYNNTLKLIPYFSDIDFVIGLDYKDYHRTTRMVSPSQFKDWESFIAPHIWQNKLRFALNPAKKERFLRSFLNPIDFAVSNM